MTAYRPRMTQAGLAPTHAVQAMDEYGEQRDLQGLRRDEQQR